MESSYIWIGIRKTKESGLFIVEGERTVVVYEGPLGAFAQGAFHKIGLFDKRHADADGCSLHSFAIKLWNDYQDSKEYVSMADEAVSSRPFLEARECAQNYFKDKVKAKRNARMKKEWYKKKWYNNGREKISSLCSIE